MQKMVPDAENGKDDQGTLITQFIILCKHKQPWEYQILYLTQNRLPIHQRSKKQSNLPGKNGGHTLPIGNGAQFGKIIAPMARHGDLFRMTWQGVKHTGGVKK